MELKEVTDLYKDHRNTADFVTDLKKSGLTRIHLRGLSGSSKSAFTAFTLNQIQGINLFIFSDKDEAAYFYNDLINLFGDKNILFFPSSYKRSVQYNQIDNGNIILRTEVLNKLASLINEKKEMAASLSIITYPEALIEKVMLHNSIKRYTLRLLKGKRISIDSICDVMEKYKYIQADFVYEPGQFAVRGGIVDVFSYSNDFPYRLDFFGDEIESIRTFDVETQLSKEHLEEIFILPNIQDISIEEIRDSFLKFIPELSRIWISDIDFTVRKIDELFKNTVFKVETEEIKTTEKNKILITGKDFIKKLEDFTVIESGHRFYFQPEKIYSFNTTLQPAFNKNFTLVGEYLKEYTGKGCVKRIYLFWLEIKSVT